MFIFCHICELSLFFTTYRIKNNYSINANTDFVYSQPIRRNRVHQKLKTSRTPFLCSYWLRWYVNFVNIFAKLKNCAKSWHCPLIAWPVGMIPLTVSNYVYVHYESVFESPVSHGAHVSRDLSGLELPSKLHVYVILSTQGLVGEYSI